MEFRKDIQGLRALAFFLVFLFHLNSNWLPGGFIGVDIFFVISGYFNAPYNKDTLMYYDEGHLNKFGSVNLAKTLEEDFLKFWNEFIIERDSKK